MLDSYDAEDDDGSRYVRYSVTDSGMDWLFENQGKFILRRDVGAPPPTEDIPF